MKTLNEPNRPAPETGAKIPKTGSKTMPETRDETFRGELVRYYSEAGPDYAAWSRKFNMHFGYYGRGMNPFRLEPMLDRMSREVLRRLDFRKGSHPRLLDAGCGVGTTARFAAREFGARVTGLSIVPWQIARAREMTDRENVRFVQGDYTRMPFTNESHDGVYAIESACYAPGTDKAALLREMFRVLKPGGRMVVADGFLKHKRPMNRLFKKCYDMLCRCWSLDTFACLDDFTAALEAQGFTDIRVEDISWHVAPSAMFVPATVVRFLFGELFSGRGPLTEKRRNNVIAPVLGLILGAARRRFGYYMVSARKPE